ncbi:MAG: hypothetical protein PHT38_09715, partial [Halothiobacillus sp.]|nr:hypothetical protein [Halothiobacillus sp.]
MSKPLNLPSLHPFSNGGSLTLSLDGRRAGVSNRVSSQAIFGFQGVLFFNMEFMMVKSFLIQAT